jgi:hypothetical protein
MTGVESDADSPPWQPAYVFLDVQDPLIAWLVYRAELVSAPQIHERALSVWATGRLRDMEAFQHETSLEQVRRAGFPDAVSRLTGFYAFADRQSALVAAKRWSGSRFREDLLAEVSIHPTATASRYDAEWITHHFGSPDSLITGMLLNAGTNLEVRYAMNFVDAKNPDFLKRFGEFEGPKNTDDLTPDSDLVQPDLTDRFFTLR